MKNVNVKVGELKSREQQDERTGEVATFLRGVFHTLRASIDILIEPLQRDANAPAATDDTPTHQVTINGRKSAELGVAWERPIERGDYKGRSMFSVALNHPDLPEWAANMAAFPRGNAGEYHLLYQRRRQPAAQAAEAGGAGEEDEIPY